MNQGIEILLARMESHPDEFHNLHMQGNTPPGTRWDALLREAIKGKFTTEEERTALQDKLSSVQGDSFTKAVLQELMREGTRFVLDAHTGAGRAQVLKELLPGIKELFGLENKTYLPNPTKAVLP